MTTRVKEITTEEALLEYIARKDSFKQFCKALPDNTEIEKIKVHMEYIPIPPKEEWVEDPLSGFGKTRVFGGNMRLPQTSNKSLHLTEEIEFNKDGSTRKIRYFNPDY